MSKEFYVFVLRDHGQDICDHCQLRGDDDLEVWENFVNGEWLSAPPDLPGFYPVVYQFRGIEKHGVQRARPAKNKKGACVWADSKMRERIKRRWSLPYPTPPGEDAPMGPVKGE